MAITATQRTDIVKVVVGLFNAAPGAIYLNNFTAYAGNTAGLTNDLIADPAFTSIYPSFLTSLEFGTKFIDALVGNAAAAADKQWAAEWIAGQLDAGSSRAEVVTLAVTELQGAAGTAKWGAAATQFANKVAVAQYYSVNMLGSATDVGLLQGVVGSVTATTDVSTPAALEAAVSATPAGTTGQTFMLTKGLDNVPGTSGNDTIIGAVDLSGPGGASTDLHTISAIDSINGGAGTDTFKIAAATTLATADLPVISNVEVIEVSAAAAATLDTSAITGVTNLNVTKAAGALSLTAASTTAVDVKGATAAITVVGGSTQTVTADQGANNIALTKGTDVSVTATKVTTGTITIGTNAATTADHPTGTITVQSSGKAFADAAPGTLGAITVNGGTVVNINQDAYAAGTVSGAAKTITQSAVTVNGGANTTTVTVTQDAAATAVAETVGVAGKNEVSVGTFTKLGTGDSITVNGLKFTAAKALTAEQVAAAFANLKAGDFQGDVSTANGYYEQANNTLAFTTGAASGATVTFTSTTAANLGAITATTVNTADTDGTGGTDIVSAAPTFVPVDGAAATPAVAPVAGVVGGKVVVAGQITGADKIATVTLDGYGATSTVASDALATLSLANSVQDVTVTNATSGASLALNLNKVGTSTANATVDLATSADYTTLNITTAGTDSFVALTADATALTVAGTNHVTLASDLTALQTVTVTGSAGVNLTASGSDTITAINTTGTTGTVTSTIGTAATYAGGAGVDNVTVGATTKALTLGAGNDTATVSVAVGAGGSIDGGDGIDTLSMTAANAVILSGNATFEAGVSNFEKVKIAVATAANQAVDMANLDDINYVVSAGGVIAAVAASEVQTVDFTGITAGGDGAFTVAGVTVNVLAADTTQQIADKVVTALNAVAGGTAIGDATATNAAGTSPIVTITYLNTAGDVAQAAAVNGTATLSALPVAATTTPGVLAATAADLDITNLASGGTLELTGIVGATSTVGVKDADTGVADSLNIILTSTGALTNTQALTVANVESFNITATDTAFDTTKGQTLDTHAFTLAATKATSITVTGNAGLNLTNTGNTKLTMIDGSAMTGALTAATTNTTAAQTIKGGSGADNLTGGVMADVLLGGAGADTLISGAGMNTLTGGDGLDKFVVGAASTNVNSYSTITDLVRGETIQFAGATSFAASKVSLGATAVFQDYANASVVGNATNALSWFNYDGDTYIIQDVNASTTAFVNGSDKIVKITGVVDLSSASFNATQGTIDWI